MPKGYSGKQVVKFLIACFGFTLVSQRGSHVKLRSVQNGEKRIIIVPMHRELAHGTLRGILRQAKIEYSEFRNTAK